MFRLSVEDIQELTGALPVSERGRDLTGKIPVNGISSFFDRCLTCQWTKWSFGMPLTGVVPVNANKG